MRVCVINCRKHAERRAAAQAKLERAGVPFEFFDGLSAADAVSRALFDAIDEREFLINTGRRITAGEIGCFASHREVWKQAADRSEAVVVMEDDFELLGDFGATLEVASSLIDRAGFIRLQTDLRAKKCRGMKIGEFRLRRYTKPPHGLMCYCLSPGVAQRFTAATRVLDAPVDVFIKKYWDHGQALYVQTPCVVGPSTLHGRTTIAGREKAAKPLPVAARRFLRKTGWYLKRWHFNWQHRDGVRRAVTRLTPGEPGARVTP